MADDDAGKQISDLTDEELEEEKKTLGELDAALDAEGEQIGRIAQEAARQLEQETAADLATIEEEGRNLESLEREADEEEKSGQIGAVQDTIEEM